jgi:hypothetical protein
VLLRSVSTVQDTVAPVSTVQDPVAPVSTVQDTVAPVSTVQDTVAPVSTVQDPVAPVSTVQDPVSALVSGGTRGTDSVVLCGRLLSGEMLHKECHVLQRGDGVNTVQ